MMNTRISFREFSRHKGPLWLYVVSLVFSLGVFLSLDSVQESVEGYITVEKQSLFGGDLEIKSNQPFSKALKDQIEAKTSEYEKVETYTFSSMARHKEEALLSQIKVVSPNYPLYGTVELTSKDLLSNRLQPGKAVVASALLNRLQIDVGDSFQLGNTTLMVSDTIESEPDQSLGLFDFGPRILVHTADLEALDLVGDKSRVSYKILAKIPNKEVQSNITEALKPFADESVKIESIEEAESSLARFSDRFLVFLKIVIFSLLILTGMGIITILRSFLTSQRTVIATRKALGESPKQVLLSYVKTFGLWAFVSVLLAIVLSKGLLFGAQNILAPILPEKVGLQLSGTSILKTFILGLGTTLLFAIFVLDFVIKNRPAQLFRSEDTKTKRTKKSWFWLLLALCIYAVFIFLELENLFQSSLFLGGILGLFFLFWFIAQVSLWGFSKFETCFHYTIKLVFRSLKRPGASTGLFLGVFSLSLTLLLSLLVIENEIQSNFVRSYPENAPNIFLLDIKKDQTEAIQKSFPDGLSFYPVIRAPITQINNKTVEEIRSENENEEWTLRRPFNLTYYDDVLETEKIIQSIEKQQLFPKEQSDIAYVSVLDTIAEGRGIKPKDTIVFNVQGIEIKTVVSSIRERRDSSSPTPFFFFVFQTKDLEKAPQTLFATAQVDPNNINKLQSDIANTFPQVSVLDTSSIGKKVGDIIEQLSGITRFFTLFNLFVGFIIFIASLMATSEDRKKEAVLYRLQGMNLKTVWKVAFYELAFIALFSIGVAIVFATLVGQIMLKTLFDLSLSSLPAELFLYAIVMMVVVVAVGSVILYKPLKTKPIYFIRKYVQE